jgi:hypothetical protein
MPIFARDFFLTGRMQAPPIREILASMHLSGLGNESMNHSVKFIEGFVENVAIVMDRRIRDHILGIDNVP